MADLHDPTPGLLAWMAFLDFAFLGAADDVGDVAVTLDDLQRWLTPVTRIETQMLGAALRGQLALDHDAGQHRIELGDIMPVSSGHDERQGDATSVDQQVSLAPIFFPGQSGWGRPALAPVGP